MQEPFCKRCDGQMDWVDCWSGCDDGYFDGYEEDPLWYLPGELEECGNCGGKGGWWQCFNSRCQQADLDYVAAEPSPLKPRIAKACDKVLDGLEDQ